MMNMQLFNYNGNNVSFRNENGNVFLNATEMAKPFGKNVGHWVRNQSTHDFINELKALRNCKGSDLMIVENGVGSWLHEDVAIEFARWLNPSFAIWCNDRIKELMKFGFTATDQTIENFVNNPDLLIEMATALKSERAKSAQSQKQLVLANHTITEQAPLVQLAVDCYSSNKTMLTSILATRLGRKSAAALNTELKKLGIQYKISGCWKLHAKYEGKGFTKTIPVPFKMKDGEQGTQNQMEWYEAGFVFLREFFAKQQN